MTSELDLMQRYMDAAPRPVPADLARSRQVLEATITGEVLGRDPAGETRRANNLGAGDTRAPTRGAPSFASPAPPSDGR